MGKQKKRISVYDLLKHGVSGVIIGIVSFLSENAFQNSGTCKLRRCAGI